MDCPFKDMRGRNVYKQYMYDTKRRSDIVQKRFLTSGTQNGLKKYHYTAMLNLHTARYLCRSLNKRRPKIIRKRIQ